MEADTLMKRYELAEKNNCDLVIDNMDKFDCQSGEKLDWAYTLNFALLPEKEVFNRHDIPDSIMDITFSTSNNKFCRLEMLRKNNLKFKEEAIQLPSHPTVYLQSKHIKIFMTFFMREAYSMRSEDPFTPAS